MPLREHCVDIEQMTENCKQVFHRHMSHKYTINKTTGSSNMFIFSSLKTQLKFYNNKSTTIEYCIHSYVHIHVVTLKKLPLIIKSPHIHEVEICKIVSI